MPTNSKEVASWHIDDIEHVSPDAARFYLEEAKAELKTTEDFHDHLTKRGYHILQILITLSILLIGFLANRLADGILEIDLLSIGAIISMTFVMVSGIFMVITVKVFIVHSSGQEPRNIAKPEFNAVKDNDEQIVEILTCSLQEYQRRIDCNNQSYLSRMRYFKIGFWTLIALSPILLLVIVPLLLRLVQVVF